MIDAHRLQQFFDFGHNCAILGMTETQIQEVLSDNRFDRWSLLEVEHSKFLDGYRQAVNPHDEIKPIDIRPIVRIYSNRTNAKTKYVPRDPNRRPTVSPEKRAASNRYWSSPAGANMRLQLSAMTRARRNGES